MADQAAPLWHNESPLKRHRLACMRHSMSPDIAIELEMSGQDPKRTGLRVGLNRRIVRGAGKGRPMALDINTFLIVFAAAVVVVGLVVWTMFNKVS